MKFYLGSPEPSWLASAGVPLMVSHRRLGRHFRLPRAIAPWVLDSGAFTELTLHGHWETTTVDYVAAARRYASEVGRLEWAAPQDWPCEPAMLTRTGLDVGAHQDRTVANLLELRHLAPDVTWLPVLQGWTLDDYRRHTGRYIDAGIDLLDEPLVGLGSVCRRQASSEAGRIIRALSDDGLRLHGFGLKLGAIDRCADVLASADSMAWSYRARHSQPLPGCTHRSCANCQRWALRWAEKVGRRIDVPTLWAEP